MLVLACLLGAALAYVPQHQYRTTTGLREAKCNMSPNSQYPPNPDTAVPNYIVDLDAPAETRWADIVTPRAEAMKALINEVFNHLPANLTAKILEIADKDAAHVLARFPEDYGAELSGIAIATGLDIGYVIIFNIFYEISSFCTSIVAQDLDGNIFHARNLDFGLLMGWDNATHDWAVSSLLRPLLVTVQFQRQGLTIYNITTYAGYVGVLTGYKKGAFSITVDTRLDEADDIPLIEWFEGKFNGVFVGFENRVVLENVQTYIEAFTTLSATTTIAPVYLTIGGTAPGEGAVITRDATRVLDIWTLGSELNNGSFFLLETNYAHWKPAPWFDDRSGPGIACMNQIGQSGVGFAGLFNVLSARPNLNAETTYTALIHVASGYSESWIQDCAQPCPLW